MKELLTDWIVNLTLVSLLSSLITRLLPGKSYIAYIKIFCGILMILTLFQPLFKFSGLEKEIEFHFMENLYEASQSEMKNKLIQMEEEQREEWEEQYKDYLEEQPDGMENEDERTD